MKFTVAALLAALITTCFAQSVVIGSPDNGENVASGPEFPVIVYRPDDLTSSTEFVLMIAIFPDSPTSQPNQTLGTILYNGPFNPQFPSAPATASGPPQQSFPVNIPSTFPKGPATLSVLHVAAAGDDNMPVLDLERVVVNVT